MKKLLLSLSILLASSMAMQAEEYVLEVKDATNVQGTWKEAAGNTAAHWEPVDSMELGNFKFAFAKGEKSSSAPAFYSENATPTVRVYLDNVMTITAPSNFNMGSVVINCNSIKGVTSDNLPTCSAGGTFAVDGKDIIWNRPETDVVLNEVVFNLPATKGGGANPNVQILSFVISTSIAETPEPEPEPEPDLMTYTKTTQITSGASYLIWADSKIAKLDTRNYGYLYLEDAPLSGNEVKADPTNAYKFTAVEGGYTIQMSDGRYLYMQGTYKSFNFSADLPAEGGLWSVGFDAEGHVLITNVQKQATMMLDTAYNSFGAYNESQTTDTQVLPTLFGEKSTGIATVATENNAAVEYFNMQGVRVAADNMPAGVYVRRQGNQTSKVLVK